MKQQQPKLTCSEFHITATSFTLFNLQVPVNWKQCPSQKKVNSDLLSLFKMSLCPWLPISFSALHVVSRVP